MEWVQIIVLALVQGVTEFLPISSSGHLILPSLLTNWPDQGLAFDVGVHFGSLLAVMFYFRGTLTDMLMAVVRYPTDRRYNDHLDFVLKLGVASIPVAVVGFLGKDYISEHLRTVAVIATTTIVFGVALWLADRRVGNQTQVSWQQAVMIGAAQVLALIPGTSRSGITITAALFLGLSRTTASRFSFLLAIPTIAGAQLLLTLDLMQADAAQRWGELLAGAALAGLSAYACIAFFIALVERTGMLPYVIYRMLLGIVLFSLIALGMT